MDVKWPLDNCPQSIAHRTIAPRTIAPRTIPTVSDNLPAKVNLQCL
jgi:hypothetical protein